MLSFNVSCPGQKIQLFVVHAAELSAQLLLRDFFAGVSIFVNGPLTFYRTSVALDPYTHFLNLLCTCTEVEHSLWPSMQPSEGVICIGSLLVCFRTLIAAVLWRSTMIRMLANRKPFTWTGAGADSTLKVSHECCAHSDRMHQPIRYVLSRATVGVFLGHTGAP